MSAAAASGVRFAPGEFRYNLRVAAALVPSLIVAAALGGRLVMAVLTVGAMVWYLLDAMALREGSLTVVRGRLGWGLSWVGLGGVKVLGLGSWRRRRGRLRHAPKPAHALQPTTSRAGRRCSSQMPRWTSTC
jgi:hypothetical protein